MCVLLQKVWICIITKAFAVFTIFIFVSVRLMLYNSYPFALKYVVPAALIESSWQHNSMNTYCVLSVKVQG